MPGMVLSLVTGRSWPRQHWVDEAPDLMSSCFHVGPPGYAAENQGDSLEVVWLGLRPVG